MLHAYEYDRKQTAELYHAAKTCLDGVLAREPNYVAGLSAFTYIAAMGYSMGWGMADEERAPLLEEALAVGQRALALAPDDAMVNWNFAWANFIGGDMATYRVYAERALALNPIDADVMGVIGFAMAASGDYDRGLALIEEAMINNPHHPEWWQFGVVAAHWSNGRTADALVAVRKINQPGNFWVYLWRTVLFTEVGDESNTAAALADLKRVYPGFTIAIYRNEAAFWQPTPEFVERVVAALRKSGLPEGAD